MKKLNIHTPEVEHFFEAVLLLDNIDECYKFFEDICTIGELSSISQRLRVAELLSGGAKFNDIVTETGASTATISRVNRALVYGADGYNMILEKLEKK